MDHSKIVLDIQCFKSNLNSYIIKEITAISLESGIILFHHIVCPPYDRKLLSQDKLRESYWLTKYFHGLEWYYGDVPYDVILEKIRDLFSSNSSSTEQSTTTTTAAVLVKGCEKTEFIKSIVPDCCKVIDLDSLGCQSLESLSNLFTTDTLRCSHHKSANHRCSLSNTVNLRKWYLLSQQRQQQSK